MDIYLDIKSLLAYEKITWVDPRNIHLTLAFLGDAGEERIMTAGLVLKRECSGFGEFDIVLYGTGMFKSRQNPKVIWVGVRTSENLETLNSRIISGLISTGFNLEIRPFRPHITLGRVRSFKEPENIEKAVEKYRDHKLQVIRADKVTLFESILKPDGPVYRPLGTFSLLF